MRAFRLLIEHVVRAFTAIGVGATLALGARDQLSGETGVDTSRAASDYGFLNERLSSLFNVPTDLPCVYDRKRNGTCLRSSECVAAGGKFRPNSACIRSTCCVYEQTCGGVVQQNNTYFVNPQYPEDTKKPQKCNITVSVATADDKARGCYLRFDFINFKIHDPVNGSCRVDGFGGENWYERRICGYNNGSHAYVWFNQPYLGQDMYDRYREMKFSFDLGNWRGARQWIIKIAYVPCDEDWTPPPMSSCLQYYTGISNTIRSFNFDERNPKLSTLIYMYYDVCIRREPGMCSIRWTSDFFSVPGEPSCWTCIGIHQGFDLAEPSTRRDRFCGDVFGMTTDSNSSSAVYSEETSFDITVNNQIKRYRPSTGFSLHYRQLPCEEPSSMLGSLL